MSITITEGTIALILGLLNIIAMVFGAIKITTAGAARFAKLELKTDTMWDVFVKGARLEAQRAGVVQQQSALRLNPDLTPHFGPLRDKLLELYREAIQERLSDNEIVLIFAAKFSDELIERLVVPNLVPNLGAALWGALQFCRETEHA